MYIAELTIHNFGQHAEKHFKFSPTSNIIVGENASGKSTVMRAIEYALQGSAALEGKTEEYVRTGSRNFKIELLLSNGIRIVRTKSDASIYNADESEPYAVGSSAVNTELTRLLGLSREDFSSIFTVKRETIEDFLKSDGVALQRLIERVLDLGSMDNITTTISRRMIELKALSAEPPDPAVLGSLKADKLIYQGRIDDYKNQLSLCEFDIDNLARNRDALVLDRAKAVEALSKAKSDLRTYQLAQTDCEMSKAAVDRLPVTEDPQTDLEAALAQQTNAINDQLTEAKIDHQAAKATYQRMLEDQTSLETLYKGLTIVKEELAALPVCVDTESLDAEHQQLTLRERSLSDQSNQAAIDSSRWEDRNRQFALLVTEQVRLEGVVKDCELRLSKTRPDDEMVLESLRRKQLETEHEISHLEKFKGSLACPTCGQNVEAMSHGDNWPEMLIGSKETLAEIKQLASQRQLSINSKASATAAKLEAETRLAVLEVEIATFEDFDFDSNVASARYQSLVGEIAAIRKQRAALSLQQREAETNQRMIAVRQERVDNYNTSISDLIGKVNDDVINTARIYRDETASVVANLESDFLTTLRRYKTVGLENKERAQAQARRKHLGEVYHQALTRLADTTEVREEDVMDITRRVVAFDNELVTWNTQLSEATDRAHALEVNLAVNEAELRHLEERYQAWLSAKDKHDKVGAELDTATAVHQALTTVRQETVKNAKDVISSVASVYVSAVTDGALSEVVVGDRISIVHNGVTRSRALTSGAQRALTVIGIKQGLATFLPTPLKVMLLDEASAAMSDLNSASAMTVLQANRFQTIAVTFREGLADNVIYL